MCHSLLILYDTSIFRKWINCSTLQRWAKAEGISLWRRHQTSQRRRSHSPSSWRLGDNISLPLHTPLVHHYPPDRNRYRLGPDRRRSWNRGFYLDKPFRSARDSLLARIPVEDTLEWSLLQLVCPSPWSSNFVRLQERPPCVEDKRGSHS